MKPIHAKLTKIRPIKVELWRHGQRLEETFETFQDAASAAAAACDLNTAAYGNAVDTRTGETWTRGELLAAGWEIWDGVEGEDSTP